MASVELPSLNGPGSNANDLLKWLQARPEEDLVTTAQALFEQLLYTASQPRSATKDACVKLCGFVQLCAKSNQASLKQWAFRELTVKQLFDYYLEWNEKDQHRSMRLALDLVTMLILRNPNAEVRQSLKADFLSTLVSIIIRKSIRPVVKSCVTSLTQFLTKSVFTLDDVSRQYAALRPDLVAQPPIILWQSWFAELFSWMEMHYISPVAGKLLVLISGMLYADSISTDAEIAGQVGFDVGVLRTSLATALSTDANILESVKNNIFLPLFKSDRKLALALLEELNRAAPDGRKGSSADDITALLHLAALEVGKKSALVDDPSLTGAAPAKGVVVLDRQILEKFLAHASHAVRSLAVSLLITSSSTTKPYSPMTFELLRRYLRSFHADPDAKFRSEILQHAKNLVKRIMNAVPIMQKDIGRLTAKQARAGGTGVPATYYVNPGAQHIANAGEAWLRESLQAHQDFFGWYLSFLLQELVPTASYQRHITALKSLVIVLKLGRELSNSAHQRIYQDPQWLRVILDLAMDPFDDVRETAVGLLMLFPADATRARTVYAVDQTSGRPLDVLTEFCSKAADLASRTSRADHSDGTARSLGLLCAWQETLEQRLALLSRTLDELDRDITMAETDLGHAVMTTPVHGAFAAVRCMWEVLSQSVYTDTELQLLPEPQSRIIGLCTRIWSAVSYVLCDDSPEGHLPEELEEIEGLDTKGLLSYSFRATHESSNLLRTIVGNLRTSRAGSLVPTSDVFRAAGDLAFNQLATLRHRGAFTSVALTFACCCQNTQQPSVTASAENGSLLDTWYQGTLSCINTQRSTTRRSAGIPAMMTGILTSNAESPSFQDVMRTLQRMAGEPTHITETDGSNLPQVHAFNCLKEIFKNSVLSKHAELYLLDCLQLATSSLKSEVWAIRNCALLLLRSLIDMLLGSTDSKSTQETGWDGKTLRLSYTKYATLPPILLNLLQSGKQAMEPGTLAQSSAAESVFPALEIIRRAGPPESNRVELYQYITKYLGSRQWHVREIAARTLCSFLVTGDWLTSIQELLQEARGSANKLHGTLLTVKFFLERTLAETKDEETLAGMQRLHSALQVFANDALMCSETAAAYIEALNLLSEATTSEQTTTTDEKLLTAATSRRQKSSRFTSIALLNNRAGTMTLRKAALSGDLSALQTCLFSALDSDIDTACAVLEATPSVWNRHPDQTASMCTLYLSVSAHTPNAEARAVALTNLAVLMDTTITSGAPLTTLPTSTALDTFQLSLHDTNDGSTSINPSLANALLRASGPIIAVHTLQHTGQFSFFTFEQRLRAWGKMIADALHAGNTFDMRMAAALALRSFTAAMFRFSGSSSGAADTGRLGAGEAAYIPAMLALYIALIDDDEDIREVGAEAAAFAMACPSGAVSTAAAAAAAAAAAHTTPQPLPAVDAADALLTWLAQRYGATHEFRAYAACRLVGDAVVAVDIGLQDLVAWKPAPGLFAAALEVDESLFAVEAHNLFVDGVRETERWAGVWKGLGLEFEEIEEEGELRKVVVMDSAVGALKTWTVEALGVLRGLVVRDDGPLGWASSPEAFELAHRVLVCGKVLVGLLGEEGQEIAALLEQIQEGGRRSRLHGLLRVILDE